MRDIRVFSLDSNTIQASYDIDEMSRALDDISANGYAAIGINFDMDGNIVILVTDVLKEKYEKS